MQKWMALGWVTLLVGCQRIAVSFTANKKLVLVQSDLVNAAIRYFWDNFHAGNYEKITLIIDRLNLTLMTNPNDLVTAAQLGFGPIWALSERQRLTIPGAAIREHIQLARRYFEEPFVMNKKDPRIYLDFLLICLWPKVRCSIITGKKHWVITWG